MKVVWFVFAIVIVVLLFVARKESSGRYDQDIQEIAMGHIVYKSNLSQKLRASVEEDTTMLRSAPIRINEKQLDDAPVDTAADTTDTDDTVDTAVAVSGVEKIDIELAVIVLSARNYKERREVIRETWGNGHSNLFFIIGKHCPYRPDQRKPWVCEPKNANAKIDIEYNAQQEALTQKISQESNVIIVDMIDVYRNLADKLFKSYRWIIQNTNAKYVLKMDDDSFARVGSVEHWLKKRPHPPKYEIIAGGFSKGPVSRRGKWAENKYKSNKYPPWPSGAGHIVSRPVIEYLHQNAETWISYQGEDTSMGIWMKNVRPQMNVQRTNSEHFITHSGDCHNKNKFVIGHSISLQKMRECYKTMDEYKHVKKAMSPENVNIDSNDKIDIVIPWAGNPRVKPQIQKEQDPTRDRYNGDDIMEDNCCKPWHKRCKWVTKTTVIPKCEEKNLLQLLQWLKNTLKNVEWRLDSGTVLGTLREKGHIPHETDIDIAVSQDDWFKMTSAIKTALTSTHYTFKDSKFPSRLFFSKTNQVHVDIWPFKRYKTTTNLWQSTREGPGWVSVTNEKLYPFKECEYEKETYPCPRDSEWYLATKYGKDWSTALVKYGPTSTFKDGQGSSWVEMPKHSCPASNTVKYKLLTKLVHVLDAANCPYNIHGGTLLGFVRDCELKDSDIDIAIPIEWRRQNEDILTKSLDDNGFKKFYQNAFGTLDKFGYETAYKKYGIKVDLFSYIDEPNHYITGLWKGSKVYRCPAKRKTIGTAMWGDVQVRVPIPYDTVLSSWYGANWKKPFKRNWRWFEDAFEVGSCIK
tara:strand:+ start:28116 stop:30521 length:2406 start_codon:yes stop_codon:yes gene_type:complete